MRFLERQGKATQKINETLPKQPFFKEKLPQLGFKPTKHAFWATLLLTGLYHIHVYRIIKASQPKHHNLINRQTQLRMKEKATVASKDAKP